MKSRVIAVIPARKEGDGVKQRNILPFCGKPVIAYSIQAALQSGIFDRVIVSTDSSEIAKVALEYGAEVPFIRNTGIESQKESIDDVLVHSISILNKDSDRYDYICCIYPVAPFVSKQIIVSTYNILIESDAEGIIPVIPNPYPTQRSLFINQSGYIDYKWPDYKKTHSKQIEVLYRDAGQHFFIKTEALLRENKSLTKRIIPYLINSVEHQDMVSPFDWKVAEYKYNLLRDISLRDAVYEDVDMLFKWRNDNETRENSFEKGELDYKDHVEWLKRTLLRDDVLIFILMVGGVPVGEARISIKSDEYLISYMIDGEYRSRGYGTVLLKMVENKLVEKYGNILMVAEVLQHNIKSRRVFVSLGYEEMDEKDRFVYRKRAMFNDDVIMT